MPIAPAAIPTAPPAVPGVRQQGVAVMLMTDHVHANERGHVSVNDGHVYVNEALTCALICTGTAAKGFAGKVRTDPAAFGMSRAAAPPVPVPCAASGDCPLGRGTGEVVPSVEAQWGLSPRQRHRG